MVNLCDCKPGDYLISKNGAVLTYSHREVLTYSHIGDNVEFPHVALTRAGSIIFYRNNGRYWYEIRNTKDIVKIIPRETQNIYFSVYENIQLLKRTSEIA